MKSAFVNAGGVLTASGYMESNSGDQKIEVDEDFNFAPGTKAYRNGVWVDYENPPLASDLMAERDRRLIEADEKTLGMGDAFVAGMLDSHDEAKFRAFALYKLALGKLDLSLSPIAWPEIPNGL